MRPSRFLTRFMVDQPKERVFGWHLQNGALSRSFPSWERLTLLRQEEVPGHQFRFYCELGRRPFVFRSIRTPSQARMQLKMEKGPIRQLDYEIEVREQRKEASEVIEKVEYLLRFPRFFPEFRKKRVEHRLRRFLAYKQEILIRDLVFFKRYPSEKSLKILVSGTSGLVGSYLVSFLSTAGHDVHHLVRSKDDTNEKSILFNIRTGEIERERLEGFDVIIHLAGKNIDTRWTRKNKQELMTSRSESTKIMAKVIASLQKPPKIFLCASATGFYGDTDNTTVDESSPKGTGFLSDLCETWENASKLLTTLGIRVAHLRFGMVLSSHKGALSKMLTPFRLGLGGIFGSGDQYISWVSVDDVAAAIYHIIMTKELSGPVNIVSPQPITNREFSKALAKHLHKHLGPHLPAAFLKMLKGQMAEEVLLSSSKVVPKKLLESGFRFYFPSLQEAFAHLIY